MDDVKQVPEETSQMQNGHIINNSETGMRTKKKNKDVSNEDLMKKLSFLQEKILEMDGRLKKLERKVESSGGAQPSEKFTVDDLYVEEKRPGANPSELGQDLLGELNGQESISIKEFEHIMKRNGKHATRTTYRNWMDKIAAEHDTIEFKKGSRGGQNKPSRLVKNYEDFEWFSILMKGVYFPIENFCPWNNNPLLGFSDTTCIEISGHKVDTNN